MSIRFSIIASLLVVSAAPIVVLGFLVHVEAGESLAAQVERNLRQVAAQHHARISDLLDSDLDRLALIVSRTQLRISLRAFQDTGEQAERVRAHRIMADAMASVNDLVGLWIIGPDGRVIASTDPAMLGADHASDSLFLEGRTAPFPGVFRGVEGRMFIDLSAPLVLDGERIGVAVLRRSAEQLIEAVGNVSGLGQSAESIIVDTTRAERYRPLTPLRFEAPGDPDQALLVDRQGRRVSFVGDSRVWTEALDYRNVSVMAVTAAVTRHGWGLIVKVDRDDAFAPVRSMDRMILLFGAATWVSVWLAAMFIARRLTRPIAMCTSKVAEVERAGDYSVRIEYDTDNEFGGLARAMNSMLARLEEHDDAMRSRLEELEKAHKMFVGREMKVIELKTRINELLARLNEEPEHEIPR